MKLIYFLRVISYIMIYTTYYHKHIILCRRQTPCGYNNIIILMIISYIAGIIIIRVWDEVSMDWVKKQKCLNAFCIIILHNVLRAAGWYNKTGSRPIHTVESVYILCTRMSYNTIIILLFEEWKWQAEKKKKIIQMRYRLQYMYIWYGI